MKNTQANIVYLGKFLKLQKKNLENVLVTAIYVHTHLSYVKTI